MCGTAVAKLGLNPHHTLPMASGLSSGGVPCVSLSSRQHGARVVWCCRVAALYRSLPLSGWSFALSSLYSLYLYLRAPAVDSCDSSRFASSSSISVSRCTLLYPLLSSLSSLSSLSPLSSFSSLHPPPSLPKEDPAKGEGNEETRLSFAAWLGFRFDGLVAALTLPLLLTMSLFIGPIAERIVEYQRRPNTEMLLLGWHSYESTWIQLRAMVCVSRGACA